MTKEEKQPLRKDDVIKSKNDDNHNQNHRSLEPLAAQVVIVFETPSKYDWVVWVLLSFVVLSCLLPLYAILVDDSIPAPDKKKAIATLLWTLVALFLVFALVLPTTLQVRSNGSIGVHTICNVTWSFGNIRAVEMEHSLFAKRACRYPRLKFATSFTSNRVLVLRKNGRWDILVSPANVDGFIKAVRSVVVVPPTASSVLQSQNE
jgi:hypothetical protein